MPKTSNCCPKTPFSNCCKPTATTQVEPAIFGTLLKRGIELNAHASSDDILTRLVQLNTERTAEEAQGRG
ncbi:MAG: hypothetical protein KA294_10590 [Giesbergeria sp.]|nr:hypothetical protein [Giesbergeria sp.]